MLAVYGMSLGLICTPLAVAAPASAAPPAPTPPTESDELYQAGKQLFDQLAPPDIKAQYDFPSREQWNAFATRLERSLEGGSLEELAGYADQARAALTALRTAGIDDDLADWLEQRIDEAQGAQEAIAPGKPAIPQRPTRPGAPRPSATQPVPYYNLWLARVRDRPVPSRAASLLPKLQPAFAAEGVPAELAWLAEAESSFNPAARSPAGAKGLFQLMPETARALGLSTFLPDERADPEKSARAAARHLRTLHDRFGNWALALAAYNAGEGRVARTLAARDATTFTAIAAELPAETRMYVPKVCALIATRTGIPPENIGRGATPR